MSIQEAELDLIKLSSILINEAVIDVKHIFKYEKSINEIPLTEIIEISSHYKRGLCVIKLTNNRRNLILPCTKEMLLMDSRLCYLARICFKLFFINVGKRSLNTLLLISSNTLQFDLDQMNNKMVEIGFTSNSKYAARQVMKHLNSLKKRIIAECSEWKEHNSAINQFIILMLSRKRRRRRVIS